MPTTSRKAILGISLLLLVTGAGAVGLAFFPGFRAELFGFLLAVREKGELFLQSVPPAAYFIAFVLLSTVGFPMTFFYLTIIPVFGADQPWIGIIAAWIGLGFNITLSYWLVRTWLHPLAESFINRLGYAIPKMDPETEYSAILSIRLSPLPFAVQNVLLALGQCRFGRYLAISWPLQGVMGLGVMLLGKSFFSGGVFYLLIGLFLVALATFLLQVLKKRIRHARKTAGQPDPEYS